MILHCRGAGLRSHARWASLDFALGLWCARLARNKKQDAGASVDWTRHPVEGPNVSLRHSGCPVPYSPRLRQLRSWDRQQPGRPLKLCRLDCQLECCTEKKEGWMHRSMFKLFSLSNLGWESCRGRDCRLAWKDFVRMEVKRTNVCLSATAICCHVPGAFPFAKTRH